MHLKRLCLLLALAGLVVLAGCPSGEGNDAADDQPVAQSEASSPADGEQSSAAQPETDSQSSGLTDAQRERLAGMMAQTMQRYGNVPEGLVEAYEFAADHRSELEQIPCWCGCGRSGHKHNRHCFFRDDGSLDGHSVGCGVCVETALMTKRGLQDGDSLKQIRERVDARFGDIGPAPTPTPEIES